MVLDTLTNDTMLDLQGALATIIHPIVMDHETNTSDFDFFKDLSEMFCYDVTFAAYCTITRNADGSVTKSVSQEKLGELVGIVIIILLAFLAYFVVGLIGSIAFPPIVICLAINAGDLNLCSGGLFK
jgi:hypothetical protein